MVDGLYSIKEASELLDCSRQNIYGRKEQLIKQGLMEQSETGTYYLNEKGINYLREKRIETMKSSSQDFNQVDSQALTGPQSPVFSNNSDLIDVLKEQIQDLKSEKEYWKKRYEEKDNELLKANEHLQDMNTTVFQRLLATEEQNRQQEENTKRGFFGFFKNNNSRH